jgi:hypothetical protein
MPAGVEPAQAVESLGLAAVPVPVSEKIAV